MFRGEFDNGNGPPGTLEVKIMEIADFQNIIECERNGLRYELEENEMDSSVTIRPGATFHAS